MAARRFAWLWVASLALAGCAADPGTTTGTDGDVPAPTSEELVDWGTIVGIVTDDSQAPLPGVNISILDSSETTTSDEAGAFTLAKVGTGKRTVAANKAGYQAAATIVEVLAGEEKKVTFILAPILVEEPFVEVFPHTLRHVVGSLLIDAIASTYGIPTCEACRWTQKTNGINQALVIEARGVHSVPNPLGPPEEYIEIQKTNPFILISAGTFKLPAKITLVGPALNDTQSFLFYALCAGSWICIDEKRDFWISAFHGQMPAPDYTAAPKP